MHSVRAFLNETQEKEKIAGMAVAITDREKILFAEGFGVESIERPEVKATPTSLFRVASITKVVTGLTLLSLVEDGKLSLHTPIKAILPWLCLKNKETETGVTLAHLLSHTSGLAAEYTPEGPLEESALEFSLKEGLPNVDILFPLGQGYQYSNWGIRLASLAAETVTGEKFTQLAYTRVLLPLGMTMTTFDLHVAATYPLCLPHTEENGVFHVFHKIQENAARQAAGGLFSNTVDLCRLSRFLLNEGVTDDGTRLLAKASMDEMKKLRGKPANFDGYGLTLFQATHREHKLFGHPGSAPPYSTSLFICPESGLGVVTLMNTQRDPLRFSIPNTIFDLLEK